MCLNQPAVNQQIIEIPIRVICGSSLNLYYSKNQSTYLMRESIIFFLNDNDLFLHREQRCSLIELSLLMKDLVSGRCKLLYQCWIKPGNVVLFFSKNHYLPR